MKYTALCIPIALELVASSVEAEPGKKTSREYACLDGRITKSLLSGARSRLDIFSYEICDADDDGRINLVSLVDYVNTGTAAINGLAFKVTNEGNVIEITYGKPNKSGCSSFTTTGTQCTLKGKRLENATDLAREAQAIFTKRIHYRARE